MVIVLQCAGKFIKLEEDPLGKKLRDRGQRPKDIRRDESAIEKPVISFSFGSSEYEITA